MATLEESFRASGTVAEALGLTSLSRFRFVVLPAVGRALGGIAVQSYGIGLVVTVAGEMLLSISGSAGYRIAELAWLIRMAELYATVCWLVIGSLLLALGVSRAPRLLVLPARLALRQEMRMLPNVLD
jgi:ABC-type nitrate/sulfonate/bicarbonate transport system permease component